jgi:hypothetical protein
MKSTIQAARILTWFNLIVWGGLLGLMLLWGLAGGVTALIIAVFLFSAIPLHSYASLRLQRSIRFPQVKLSNQTPVGVRFIGFVALFFGICTMINAFVLLQDPKTAADSMKSAMVDTKGINQVDMISWLRGSAIFVMVMGLAVIINVVLNIRLLRWYYLVKQSDVS